MRVDEHTIELGSSPVFYRATPAVGVPTLYVHGSPTSSDDWVPFLERTGGIAPDLPGFGRSGKAGDLDYSLSGLADFLERFLKELRLDRLRLVGHDWGAAAALVLAQRHPQLVERLVIANAVPLLEGFRWHRIARVWRRRALGELVMGSTTKWLLARGLRHGSVRPDAWTQSHVNAVWEQFDQGTQRAILRLYRSGDERSLVQAGAGLESLRIPALVIWGERDPWLPPELAEAYAARLPEASLERIADAGHWPWLDQPAVFDLLANYLRTSA